MQPGLIGAATLSSPKFNKNPCLIPQIRVPSPLHLLLHLFRKQPRLALLTLLELAFAIGLGLQAFRSRAAAFFAACRCSDGNSEQEKKENAERTGKFHDVSSE